MQCYSEILPPTAVTDAVAIPLIQQGRLDLVVAKTSLLQVFKVHDARDGDSASSRLLLIGEYQLSGTITALRRVHTQDDKNGIDSLLVAFRHAKISLVRWDHENHRITTVSIHLYEGDTVPRQPCDTAAAHTPSILTVDPSSRCAALKFDQRQLAILPFRQGGEENDIDEMELEDKKKVVQNGTTHETPYKKSFVLSLPSLDESLTDLVDLAFLHDYREPTLGILTSAGQPSNGLWSEGKDILTYHVLTLDLEQGASTILVSIPLLPASLRKVKPLPAPIGGVVLLGTNEAIHISQSGKTHAIIVNEFAEMTGGITTTDQISLDLKLEDCIAEVLDAEAGDVLFSFRDGSLAVLHFSMLGPEVKSLSFTVIAAEAGGSLLEGLPSCIASLDNNHVFLGTDEADSVLALAHSSASSRKRSHAEMLDVPEEDQEEEEEDDDDDLYATTTRQTRSPNKTHTKTATYSFELRDTLQGLGPASKPCFGKAEDKLEMATITGRGKGSRLTLLSRDLRPIVQQSYEVPDVKAAWSIESVKPKKKRQTAPSGTEKYLFVYDGAITTVYQSPWSVASPELVELKNTEFEQDGETIDIGTLGSGRWIVHCRQGEVRTYEADLGLSQIIPMVDEASDAELTIVHTHFCDPYLLLVRDDGSLQILAFDAKTQDVEPLEMGDILGERKCLSGSLYKGSLTGGATAAFVLLDDGSLQILSLPDLKSVYTAISLPSLPPILSTDPSQRRPGFKETLTEIFIADIGVQGFAQPYLILRTSADDLILYEPFKASSATAWTDQLRFRKVPVPYLPKYDEYLADAATEKIPPLRSVNIGTYVGVAVPGRPPCLILAESGSRPKILRVHGDKARTIVSTHTEDDSFVSITTGMISRNTLSDTCVSTGWSARKISIGGDELSHIAYHESGMYVLATSKQVDFLFSEEDTRHQDQDDIKSRPTVPQYSLHLFSASTHRIINTYTFPPGEAVACLEVLPLDTSEHTHKIKPLVSVGTALLRGEDMPTKGALTLFELQPVIPEPNDPETGIKLHVLSRENVKGAVTTVAPFVGGLIGIAQGQKILVRGMKEDGSCLPVAFLDCLCQLSTLKTLWQTGLWLAGDQWKGLWFGGFTEDPYKLTFLGKSQTHMEVRCAELLPFESQLFVLAIDADMDLHILQYDPEDPKTVSGTRLLHRATFHTGHWPTSMTLVPSTLAPLEEQTNGHVDQSLYQVMITTQSGAVHLLTPLENAAYRRLANLYGQMTSILEHAAALNPREYRAADGDVTAARGVIDGTLLQRIGELGSARRAEVLGRCGSDAWTLRSDLEIICGGGLSWL